MPLLFFECFINFRFQKDIINLQCGYDVRREENVSMKEILSFFLLIFVYLMVEKFSLFLTLFKCAVLTSH